jgi:Ca-activated chloride channel family protein
MVGIAIAVAAMALAAVAEAWHVRRVRRIGWLAFGPGGSPRPWTRWAAPLRVLSCGALAWGLLTLLSIDRSAFDHFDHAAAKQRIHHVVIALDVSPSMHLVDSGPRASETRGDRARAIIASVLARLDLRRTRISVVAFYSHARPVVIDTFDPEVAANVLADLPLEQAFHAGKTDLYSGVKAASDIGRPWREGSATLLVLSDGDTLPHKDTPVLPKAFGDVLVLGVGNPQQGLFIDGHSSRQDAASLERLALQLRGRYFDVNTRHLPSHVLLSTVPVQGPSYNPAERLRGLAFSAVIAGASVLALLPVCLALAGAGYRVPHVPVPPPRQRSLALAASGD